MPLPPSGPSPLRLRPEPAAPAGRHLRGDCPYCPELCRSRAPGQTGRVRRRAASRRPRLPDQPVSLRFLQPPFRRIRRYARKTGPGCSWKYSGRSGPKSAGTIRSSPKSTARISRRAASAPPSASGSAANSSGMASMRSSFRAESGGGAAAEPGPHCRSAAGRPDLL